MEALLDIKCPISMEEFFLHCLAVNKAISRLSIFVGHTTVWNQDFISRPSFCLMLADKVTLGPVGFESRSWLGLLGNIPYGDTLVFAVDENGKTVVEA